MARRVELYDFLEKLDARLEWGQTGKHVTPEALKTIREKTLVELRKVGFFA